jgi:peptidoglycan/LPS O-acetylase OafA/YrhL
MKNMQRNFALDCFRALAIMMVFTGHTINSLGSPLALAPLQFGGTGVDLFFLLSGWLIGNQLLIEKKKYGDIDIKRFWSRRWMRTLPAYYAVLSATILQQYLTKEDFSFPWAHLFFLQNYQTDLELFYVSWSLSVEEQFYLLIAPLIAITFKFNKTSQTIVLILLLVSPSIFRLTEWYDSLNETHVRLDCCAMGVLLAYCKHYHFELWEKFSREIHLIFPIAIASYILFYLARYFPDWGIGDPSKLGLALIFGVWIIWADRTSFHKKGLVRSVIMHISTRSYAMYLLHVDALVITKKLIANNHVVIYYFVALAITLILSEVLYRAIEVPIMSARKNFSFSMSRSNLDIKESACKEVVKHG